MAETAVLDRPKRWDVPFDPDMLESDLEMVMARPEVTAIDSGRFPAHMPLDGIIRNDMRVVRYPARSIIVRQGDYGNSAFLLLQGSIRSDMSDAIASKYLGRLAQRKKGPVKLFKELFFPNFVPELRDVRRYSALKEGHVVSDQGKDFTLINEKEFERLKGEMGGDGKPRLERAGQGTLFGEAAAIGRVPHNITHIAETEVTVLEIKWQGLRDVCKYDEGWRISTEASYHRKALVTHLRECDLFEKLDDQSIQLIADHTQFETIGSYDWHVKYKQTKAKGGKEPELPLRAIDDHPDGLILIISGMARVSSQLGNGLKTITYLKSGEYHGLCEMYEGWKDNKIQPLRTALTVLGYVHILRIPTHIIEKVIFPNMKQPPSGFDLNSEGKFTEAAFLEWAVEQRFINGTKTMVINLDKCVRCDDCVRACAASHEGNPRFVRHGRIHDHWMVANSCQHCNDPVCMIGCPTGAIHRNQQAGVVVINDDTCIGCGACVAACPYENIRKVEIKDSKGKRMLDPVTLQPIEKSTKCDFCYQHPGGPNCVKACPHGALSRIDFRSRFNSAGNRGPEAKVLHSKNTSFQNFSLWSLAIIAFAYLSFWVWDSTQKLIPTGEVTGYTLIGSMIFLAMLKMRKRMSVVSFVRVAWWKYAHVVIGVFVMGVFFLHTKTMWPAGVYEQLLTALFYGVVLTGIWGVLLQKLYPPQLNLSETEVIFERVPDELSAIRNQAEQVIKDCTAATGSETIGKLYIETFDWFFRRPRFMM
ncbi:MAG: 4Fe-4S dicluster domain-containing protein, partial [Methylococcales bacterium]|nr:4Fe-4S dicluster domain-containing protein [Methylococcales bacterium]